MKKTFLYALTILTLLALASCSFGKKLEFPEGFFDTKPSSSTNIDQEVKKPNPAKDGVTQKDTSENSEKTYNSTKQDSEENKQDEENPDTQKEPFSHSEEEKAEIVSRYNEAESLYYDILSQNFELDNMDVVTAVADGYETNFHRVILGDVNSLSELRSLYGRYFTAAFIGTIDLSAYREADGKLYCAPTQGSARGKGNSYTAKVESVDETNAIVVRRDSKSGGVQKIPAVKHGDIWYFGGVAVR